MTGLDHLKPCKRILTFVTIAGSLLLTSCMQDGKAPTSADTVTGDEKAIVTKIDPNLSQVILNDFTAHQVDIPLPKQEELLFGKYLSGRQAIYNRDFGAAARFNIDVLETKKEDIGFLRRTFSLSLTDGRYNTALSIAADLKAQDKSDSLIDLILFLEQAKLDLAKEENKDYSASYAKIDDISEVGIYGLFKPYLKAWMLAKEGKTDEVLALLETALSKPGFKDFKNYHAAIICDYLGLNEKADQYYAVALKQAGAMTLRTIEVFGNYLQRSDKSDSAGIMYEEYLSKAPANETLLFALKKLEGETPDRIISSPQDGMAEIFYSAAVYLMQDQIKTVATLYLRNSLYMQNDFAEAEYLLGQIFELDKYYAGALKSYGKISKSSYLNYRAGLQGAWIYNKMDQQEKSIKAMENLAKDYPDHQEIYAAIGDIYRMDEKFKSAEINYSKYISSIDVPEEYHWSFFFTRGIVRERNGNWENAEKDFFKALELKKDEPQVLNYLAYSWVDRGEYFDKAKEMLEKAVRLRPNDGYIIDSLGWALFKMGQIEESVPILEKAVQLQSDDWAINDHLGDVFWLVGRENEARFQWRHALSLKPDDAKKDHIKHKIRFGYSIEK